MPAKEQTESHSPLKMVHIAVTLVIMLGFGYLPAPAPITPVGMKVLGVFIALLYGWTFSGLVWPSLLGLAVLSMSGATTLKEIFVAGFGNDSTAFVIFIMIFLAVIEKMGVTDYLANWFISRKFLAGRPYVFSFFILLGTYLISALVSTLASIFVFWGIIYSVCKEVGYKPYDKYPTLMIFGVIFMAQLGSCVFPFKVVVYMLLGVFKTISGLQVDFLKYFLFTSPLGLLILCAFVLLCRFVLRPDVSPLSNIKPEQFAQKLTLGGEQKIGIGFLIALFTLLFLPSILPDGMILKTMLTMVGSPGTVMVILGLMAVWQYQHKPLIDFAQAAAKGVGWDMIIITITILPLCSILTADVTGIKPFLIAHLGPMLSGQSAAVFGILLIVIAVVTTNFLNNAVVGIVLLSITFSLSATMSINCVAMAALIVFCAHIAIMTPAASIWGALFYSNSDWIKPTDGYKYSFITVLMTLIIIATVGLVWLNIIF